MNEAQFLELAAKISRSSIAIIDAISQRGAFKGEELSTVGQLRDQCVQLVQNVEERQQEMDDEEDEE
tara:strand:- start:1387 stop:1587 length:201 start_codon:yes stop_codon:yes gene_type:complete